MVSQHRQWAGDPRLGAFVLSVDGQRVGVVPVLGRLAVTVGPDEHVVRIRQWWYRSAPVVVTVGAGATVCLKGDIPVTPSFVRRMGRFLAQPSRALTLTPLDN